MEEAGGGGVGEEDEELLRIGRLQKARIEARLAALGAGRAFIEPSKSLQRAFIEPS